MVSELLIGPLLLPVERRLGINVEGSEVGEVEREGGSGNQEEEVRK